MADPAEAAVVEAAAAAAVLVEVDAVRALAAMGR